VVFVAFVILVAAAVGPSRSLVAARLLESQSHHFVA